MRKVERYFSVLYVLFWLGGVLSYLLLGGPPSGTGWAASTMLAVAAVCVWLSAPRTERLLLVMVGLVGLFAEWLGVRTGFPFGAYHYTDALVPHLFGVSLPIACAWIVLAAYTHRLLAGKIRPSFLFPFVAAAWMVALDLLIDPLAAGPLDYWRWERAGLYCGIPFSNFAGWYLVSLVLFLFMPNRPFAGSTSLWIGLSMVLFFTVIAVARAIWPAAFVGIALCVLHACLLRRERNACSPRPQGA